jgi:hypothetical protein
MKAKTGYMTAEEMVEIAIANRDGITLEFQHAHADPDKDPWRERCRDLGVPLNFHNFRYRIKPKPAEVWAVVDGNNSIKATFTVQEAAEATAARSELLRAVLLREVTSLP